MQGVFIVVLFAEVLGILIVSATIFRYKGWHWKVGSLVLLVLAFVLFVGTLLFAAPI